MAEITCYWGAKRRRVFSHSRRNAQRKTPHHCFDRYVSLLSIVVGSPLVSETDMMPKKLRGMGVRFWGYTIFGLFLIAGAFIGASFLPFGGIPEYCSLPEYSCTYHDARPIMVMPVAIAGIVIMFHAAEQIKANAQETQE